MREMIWEDLEVVSFSTDRAHRLIANGGLSNLFYAAQTAHDIWRRNGSQQNAVASDKARGAFYIAVCEWAVKHGAALNHPQALKAASFVESRFYNWWDRVNRTWGSDSPGFPNKDCWFAAIASAKLYGS